MPVRPDIGDQQYSYACKKDFSFFYKPKSEAVGCELMIVIKVELYWME